MKKIVQFLIILLLTACTDQTFEQDNSEENRVPEGKVCLSVNLISGGFNKPTKTDAGLTESTLTNIWALCFENPNPDTYDAGAILRNCTR